MTGPAGSAAGGPPPPPPAPSRLHIFTFAPGSGQSAGAAADGERRSPAAAAPACWWPAGRGRGGGLLLCGSPAAAAAAAAPAASWCAGASPAPRTASAPSTCSTRCVAAALRRGGGRGAGCPGGVSLARRVGRGSGGARSGLRRPPLGGLVLRRREGGGLRAGAAARPRPPAGWGRWHRSGRALSPQGRGSPGSKSRAVRERAARRPLPAPGRGDVSAPAPPPASRRARPGRCGEGAAACRGEARPGPPVPFFAF